jgi:hypothetical protein
MFEMIDDVFDVCLTVHGTPCYGGATVCGEFMSGVYRAFDRALYEGPPIIPHLGGPSGKSEWAVREFPQRVIISQYL